jgi:hypothetical protein
MIWPSVLCLFLDVSQKYIPQSKEFTDIKNILFFAAPPAPLRPRQLPCLPTPRHGSASMAGSGTAFTHIKNTLMFLLCQCKSL